MSFSPILAVYRVASAALGAFAGFYLSDRAKRGKEDPARLGERFGRYIRMRPNGAVVWVHAASVGESGVAIALIEALATQNPALSFVLTTGTRTSAELVARRAPARTTHVYVPLDRADCVRRFLDYWRPDVGVFVESELWPNLILEAEARGVKLALVNARMSPRTLRRWTSWRTAGRRLVGAFRYVSAADERTKDALAQLRPAPLGAPGNLNLAAPAPRVDANSRAALAAEIGQRPIWLAASTHQGEDEIVLAAHAILQRDFPKALLIIAPRHPERGADVARLANNAPLRSTGAGPGNAPIYVADTLGELGTLYDLAPVSLVAGSLLPHLKGHNPIEPAKLGSAIITGPYVESFQDLFAEMLVANAARRVTDAESLAAEVANLWRDEAARTKQLEAARTVTAQGADAFARTLNAILALAHAAGAPQSTANASA
ncbi:MAG: 3-deoxy-D-manno-octulosonic acid transferase [Alphaproteobacteria bacterium]|nr:3-deoxy-D-manno-octulosonic acid transferase [Alphaproteobacteria bacterium]